MKYILPILFLSISFFNLKAQVAPDFTLTDINNETHHLYTYLSQGKTVVIHFAEADCVECWDFHETQNMNLANDAYGENGTDEMVFLLLETDTLTDMAELQGMGLYTEGDWTDGTSYPIIDNAENVAADYGITDLPTVIAICAADTSTTDLYTAGYPTVQDMYIVHNRCTPATTANDFTIIDLTTDVFCGTLDPELLLVNTGTDTISTATFIVSTNTETDTISWSGSIAPNEVTTLVLGTALETATEVTVTIEDVNGTPDASSFTKTVTKAKPHCVEQLVITVLTDNFGCETKWNISGLSGNSTGGNTNATAGQRTIEYDDLTGVCIGAGYDNNTSYTVTYPAPDPEVGDRLISTGCYEFRIFDDWGDGMCCENGDGSYTIADQDGNILAMGGDFGAEETVRLDIKLAVSGGTIVSPDIELCIDSTLNLRTANPITDPARGLGNIAWGIWILDDPLDQSAVPAGGLPDDQIPNDDPNFANYWEVNGQAIFGDSVQISGDGSGITYYIAPLITDAATEFDSLCTGLNTNQGYTVFMNPREGCLPVSIDSPIPVSDMSINPNPVKDYFNLNFNLKQSEQLSIYLHNAIGQKVKHLSPNHYSAGENIIQIETRHLPSGMYIITLQTEKGSISKKVTVTKP